MDPQQAAELIESLRQLIMFGDENTEELSSDGLDPLAQSHVCLALTSLETAYHHMKAAEFQQAGALAQMR